jgi:hypothetical protein
MNLQLAEQHKVIVERCKDLLQVILIEDKDVINEIMNKSQLKIDNYNKDNSTVINPTKYELSTFKSTAKRVVNGKYSNVFIRTLEKPKYESDYLDYLCDKEQKQKYEGSNWVYEYYDSELFCDKCKNEYNDRQKYSYEYQDEKNRIINEFQNACENTHFEEDLRLRSISLSRSITNHNPTELQKVLKKQIHNEILIAFEQQNKELISKYNF